MKFVIQRVTEANVKVDNKIIGEIGKGFMVLIGVGQEDTFNAHILLNGCKNILFHL